MTTLEKMRAEIEQVEINGYIRDVECFRAGINTALNVLDKYAEQEPTSPCDLCIFYSMDGDNKYCGYIGECPARAKGW